MEIVVVVTGVVGFLIGFDLVELRWGANQTQTDWLAGNYDPREDWSVSCPSTYN